MRCLLMGLITLASVSAWAQTGAEMKEMFQSGKTPKIEDLHLGFKWDCHVEWVAGSHTGRTSEVKNGVRLIIGPKGLLNISSPSCKDLVFKKDRLSCDRTDPDDVPGTNFYRTIPGKKKTLVVEGTYQAIAENSEPSTLPTMPPYFVWFYALCKVAKED